jgi:tetratricopeptide (TPR) repeat protein
MIPMRHFRRTFLPFCAGGLFLFLPYGALSQTEDLYAKATAAFQNGDYSNAASLFERAEIQSPGKTDALLFAGKSYAHLEKFGEAESVLRRYLANNTNSADALYLLGFVLHRENKPADSLAIYTKAAAITPPGGDDLKIVALNYVLLKDYADASHWLERAVQMDPKNKDAWYYLGRTYYTQSFPQKARKAFETALALDPHDSKAENNLGLLFETDGNTESAIGAYRKAIEWQISDAHPSEQPYLNLGNLFLTLDRLEEAIGPLEKAVELAPTNPQAHLRLGMAYARKNRVKEAQVHLEAAVRLDPNDAPSHYQLGRYYKQVNDLVAAKKEFDRVAEIQNQAIETQKSPIPQ